MNSLFHAITDHVNYNNAFKPNVIFDHIVTPSSDLQYNVTPFGNSKAVNQAMIQQGEKDALLKVSLSEIL
jgi:hypothetical protein